MALEDKEDRMRRLEIEREKKKRFIEDLKKQIHQKKEIDYLRNQEEIRLQQNNNNLLIDEQNRVKREQAMKEFHRLNLQQQIEDDRERKR